MTTGGQAARLEPLAKTHDTPWCFALNCTLDHAEIDREMRDAPIGPHLLADNERWGYGLLHDVITRHSFHNHDCQTTVCKAMFIWNSWELGQLLLDAYNRGAAAPKEPEQ